jgi:hypothetical protein
MYLTKDEERLLHADNPTIRKCMEILVAIGEIFNADRLINVKSVQISGISYQNIGDAGLEWIEGLNAKFVVKAMINPAGMDIRRWREMDIDKDFYRKQMRIINALISMGAESTLTCTPYYIEKPSFGDHLAWAESNAVVYANSLIGARTNRESGISALASGIIGKTPNYGLHVDENREPTVIVNVKEKIRSELLASILGLVVGERVANEVPYFRFPNTLSEWQLKVLGATLSAKGNTALFHVEGQTPEWSKFDVRSLEKIEIDGLKHEFDQELSKTCEPDLIALGCPHLSEWELEKLYELTRDKRAKKEFWVFTSRETMKKRGDLINALESRGIKVFGDTCMVVSPATEKFDCIMINSGKAFVYLPKLRGVNAKIAGMEDCVREGFNR